MGNGWVCITCVLHNDGYHWAIYTVDAANDGSYKDHQSYKANLFCKDLKLEALRKDHM